MTGRYASVQWLRYIILAPTLTLVLAGCGDSDSFPPPPPSQAPQLAAIGNQTVSAGRELLIGLSAVDPQGGTVTFSAAPLPGNSYFLEKSGVFCFYPDQSQAGQMFALTFTASNATASDSEVVTITVTAAAAGGVVLAPIGDRTARIGEPFSLQLAATGPAAVAYDMFPEPALQPHVALDRNAGLFTFTPSSDQVGHQFEITFRACVQTNGRCTADQAHETIHLTVLDVTDTCIEQEFMISAANGWLPLSDTKCTNAGAAVVGGSGQCLKAYVDGTQAQAFGTNGLASISVQTGGVLVFEDTFVDSSMQAVTLHVGQINVGPQPGDPSGANPQLVIGSVTCPIQESTVTIEFSGDPPATSSANYLTSKGIIVGTKGELFMHGNKGVVPAGTQLSDNNGTVSWAYLTTPAGPAKWNSLASGIGVPVPTTAPDTTLQLSKAVDWQPGDWIVVASTDFAEDHQEIVQISPNASSVAVDTTNDTSTILLNPDTPLLHYHFGGPAPSNTTLPSGTTTCNNVALNGVDVDGLPRSFCDGVANNNGVDERAEVELLSRSIKLTAAIGSHTHYGGQIQLTNGVAAAEIEGVELEKFGQDVSATAGGVQNSAYPIQFNTLANVPADVLVNSNSIHHSYNKCVGINQTNGITVQYTVCARNIGHSFYLQEGSETGNVFYGNLVAGAMATVFTPSLDPTQFWTGDYLAPVNGYNGIAVANTAPSGRAENAAPSAFWIAHPDNTYVRNSVSGCQLQGRGYWILPQTTAGGATPIPAGGFVNNRVHGCYHGVDTAADAGATAVGFTPQTSGKDVIAYLDGITATRIRNRGIWLRPAWYHVDNARIATTRDGISLVSAGGVEGSPPGEWSILTSSVLIGISNNNPERFGPCPNNPDGSCYGMGSEAGNGFPNPHWNFAGFMFYDGPARLERVRFVNFNVAIDLDPQGRSYLTSDDRSFLQSYVSTNPMTTPAYEGDAALGWFQSNVNNYPPTQYNEALIWQNTDFKHQVYTAEVNLAAFVDGDKNTVILDRDGTLSGFAVVDASGNPVAEKFPISLNNLEFNGIAPASGSYSVDECHATGAQDTLAENRATAMMSPESYATLETTVWDPTLTNTAVTSALLMKKNPITIIKDQQDFPSYAGSYGFEAWSPHHYNMTLVGRNLTQVREPKVMRGGGYTLHSFVEGVDAGGGTIAPPHAFPRFTSVGLSDVTSGPTMVDPTSQQEVFVKPFRIRVGICYKAQSGYVPPSGASFKIDRGRVSLGGPIGATDPSTFQQLTCNNFVFNDPTSFNPNPDVDPTTIVPQCPALGPGQNSTTVPQYTDWTTFETNQDGYYYDATKGMLFFYVEQDEANAVGPAPIGSCTSMSTDEPCVDGQEFYSCPADGCVLYTVRVTDSNYLPLSGNYGPTNCEDVYQGDQATDTTNRDYTQTYPPNGTVNWSMDRLAYAGGTTLVDITAVPTNTMPPQSTDPAAPNFAHNQPTDESLVSCPTNYTGPANQTVIPPPVPQGLYFIAPAGGYTLTSVAFTATDGEMITAMSGTPTFTAELDLNKTWTMVVNTTNGHQCTDTVSTSGSTTAPTWSRTDMTNQCLLGGGGNTIALGPF